ncbi:MAG TPA: pilus assembly protein TadG-related protein, partial [Brevundimonas sp.]
MTSLLQMLERGRLWLRSFRHSEQGNIAVIFALAAPALFLIGVGAIDLGRVQSNRVKLQDIADAAALAGANELGLAINDTVAIERAKVFVQGHVLEWKEGPDISPEISVISKDG